MRFAQSNFGARRRGREVVVVVRRVVADAVGPAVVAGAREHVVLDRALRAAVGVGGAGVRAVVAHQHPARLGVDRQPERVAEAHAEDLRARLRRAFGEEVAGGDRVGRRRARAMPSGISIGLIRRILPLRSLVFALRALRVPRGAAGALVDRVVAARVEGVRVVARRDVQAPVRPEVQRARRVAALPALVREREDALLGAQVQRVAVDLEARDDLRVRAVGQLRVEQVDPVAEGEIGRQLQPEQAVLLRRRDRHGPRGHGLLGVGLPDHQAPIALDVEHAPVRSDVELHRVLRVVVQRHLLEVGGDRGLRSRNPGPGNDQQQRRQRDGERVRAPPTHDSLLRSGRRARARSASTG